MRAPAWRDTRDVSKTTADPEPTGTGRAGRPLVTLVLRRRGLRQLACLYRFYRYFLFNVPRVTTVVGVVVLVGIAAIHLYLLSSGFGVLPAYLAAYFAVLVTAVLVASAAMSGGRGHRVARLGWALGAVVSAASLAMYLASRTAGLPGLPLLVGWWDYPLGTFAMALAALFLVLHFSVLTGANVAVPRRREWHD